MNQNHAFSILIVFSAMLTISLTACGGNSPVPTPLPPTSSAPTTTTVSPTLAPPTFASVATPTSVPNPPAARPSVPQLKLVNGNNTLRVGDRTRTFILYQRSVRFTATPQPLLFVLHGHGGRGTSMVQLTGLNMLADRNGFVVLYPDGVDETWNDGHFSDPAVLAVDDVGFISALIDALIVSLNIDPKRVYVTGFSNGGVMSHRLGCDLSEKIAAIAPVSGLLGQDLVSHCAPKQPMSVIQFHGTADPIAPFNGGTTRNGTALSAYMTIGNWAKLEGCATTPEITNEPDIDPNDGTRVQRRVYGGCRNNAGVILYVIENGGHAWPGSLRAPANSPDGKTSRDINASQLIWDFFVSHPKP